MNHQNSLTPIINEILQEAHRPMYYLMIAQRVRQKTKDERGDLELIIREEMEVKAQDSFFETVAPDTFLLPGYDWQSNVDISQTREPRFPTDFRIISIDILNFRGFEEKFLEFSDQFTLLIGDNGAGKTAILDALAIGMGAVFEGFNLKTNRINKNDIRVKAYQNSGVVTFEPQPPTAITCRAIVDNEIKMWTRSTLKITERGTVNFEGATKDLVDVVKNWGNRVRHNLPITLPLITCYGTGRLWLPPPKKVETRAPGSRLEGYQNALDPFSGERALVEWFKTRTLVEIQQGSPDPTLQAVKRAVLTAIVGWEEMKFDINSDQLVVRILGEDKPFRILSDGLRNMAALVADLAHRAALLNPHLGESVVEKTPGVVLIDEIDLHLHPNWQRTVVDDLKRTFPLVQFIATTHSPFIVQSLRPGELIDMNAPAMGKPAAPYADRSIEDVAEEVMGVENVIQSVHRQEMIKTAREYAQLLQEGTATRSLDNGAGEEVEAIKQRLDELIAPYSDDPAYQALLELQRFAVGLENDKKDEDASR